MTMTRPNTGWDLGRVTTHPGLILWEDFMKPLELNVHSLSLKLRVAATRLHGIVHEKRGITPETALRLGRYFGTTPEFWMNLQMAYDLSRARLELASTIEQDVEPRSEIAAA